MAVCVKCEEQYPDKRRELGYETCLKCGGKRKKYTVGIPYNKGGYQLITRKYIKDMGKK